MSSAENKEKLRSLLQNDPRAAMKLLEDLKDKVVIPHPGGQSEIMDSSARFKVVCCGRRFGKTVVGAKLAIDNASKKQKQMVWWVAPTYKIVKRGYREVLRQLPRDLLTHPPPEDSAFDAGRSVVLKFKNGSRMEFYSAERPEGMLGEGVDYVVLDEASKMSKAVWDQTVRPTLIDREGGALMISTPTQRNWFYYQWLKGQKLDGPYASWKFPSWANPYLPKSEIEEMRDSLPLLVFQQEVEAEFIASAGAVFRFNPLNIVEKSKPEGHVVIGIDLAKSNDFTVLSAVREDGKPCGYDRFNDVAWRLQRQRIKSFVRKLMIEGAVSCTLMMDSTGVGDPIVEDIEADGYDVVPINFTKTKAYMVAQLSKDLEDGYALLDKQENIDEFENYTYKVTEGGKWTYGAPEGQHDDCVSARMLAQWGLIQEGTPNIIALHEAEDPELDTPKPFRDPEDEMADGDYSDLLEELENERSRQPDIPEKVLVPDSFQEIMERPGAWNSSG